MKTTLLILAAIFISVLLKGQDSLIRKKYNDTLRLRLKKYSPAPHNLWREDSLYKYIASGRSNPAEGSGNEKKYACTTERKKIGDQSENKNYAVFVIY